MFITIYLELVLFFFLHTGNNQQLPLRKQKDAVNNSNKLLESYRLEQIFCEWLLSFKFCIKNEIVLVCSIVLSRRAECAQLLRNGE